MTCGLDLYAQGVRRPPIRWFRIAVVLLLVSGASALTRVWIGRKRVDQVEVCTRELLKLLARGKPDGYAQAVEKFCEPNDELLRAANEQLGVIFGGLQHKLKNVESRIRGQRREFALGEIRKVVDRLSPKHPDYVREFLVAAGCGEGELHDCYTGKVYLRQDRARPFFAWYLSLAFRGLDITGDEPVTVSSLDESGSATVTYSTGGNPIDGVASASPIRWRRHDGGKWVLDLKEEDLHLDEVIDTLTRLQD